MSHEHTLKCGDLTEKIIGVFYDVYNELGYGFLESVYQEALVMALREAGLAVECQVPVPVWFRRQKVGDFRAIDPAHEAQLLHYLKATEIELGLLLNFGTRPQFRRLLFDDERKKIRGNPCESVAGVSG